MSGSIEEARSRWVDRVLAFQIPAAPAPAQGRAAWTAARAQAIAGLGSLEAAVKTSAHAGRDRAIILLRAIRANLTEMPTTLQQVTALRRYLTTDDIIAAAEAPNVFGVKIALRTPLLAALQTVQSQLSPDGKSLP